MDRFIAISDLHAQAMYEGLKSNMDRFIAEYCQMQSNRKPFKIQYG